MLNDSADKFEAEAKPAGLTLLPASFLQSKYADQI
jgi:hypothetical protein